MIISFVFTCEKIKDLNDCCFILSYFKNDEKKILNQLLIYYINIENLKILTTLNTVPIQYLTVLLNNN